MKNELIVYNKPKSTISEDIRTIRTNLQFSSSVSDSKVILITSNRSKLKEIDIEKYNSEYNNLCVKYDDTFHDRYIILDKSIIYHLGASINHAGSKTFSINILEDNVVKEALLNLIFVI